MFKRNHDPIVVVVEEDRYYCLGPITARSQRLYAILQQMGGINESVTEGFYHFNVRRRGFRLEASLTPLKN